MKYKLIDNEYCKVEHPQFEENFKISTKTTGFGSPAESYVDKRLDLNQLVLNDVYTTYYFKSSEDQFGIKKDDILVVDRGITPSDGDIIVIEKDGALKLTIFNKEIKDLWGTITWTLSQIKK